MKLSNKRIIMESILEQYNSDNQQANKQPNA